MCNCSITPGSITRYINTMHHEEIKVDTEVEDKVEEDLDEEEVQECATTASNHNIMQGSVHFHQRHVCTVVQQIMT
jgi:chorismate-pyruvate lyase